VSDAGPETLRELVGAYLTVQCGVLTESAAALRDGKNVIHRTRVAARRLRSTLRVFEDLFEGPQAAWMDSELQWWAGVLGAVRDLDVLEPRLEARLAALPDDLVLGPVRAELAETVAARRQRARADLVDALESPRYRQLLATVGAWTDDPPFTAAADRPAAKAARYVKRADRKVTKRLAEAVEAYRVADPAAGELLHRARKAGKRHRYAAEAMEPVWGAKAEKVVSRRKQLQELLGDHQDSVVAGEFLRELGAGQGSAEGRNGFTWGVLYGQELANGDRVVAQLKKFR
jgi:CHAD domain-containing protein